MLTKPLRSKKIKKKCGSSYDSLKRAFSSVPHTCPCGRRRLRTYNSDLDIYGITPSRFLGSTYFLHNDVSQMTFGVFVLVVECASWMPLPCYLESALVWIRLFPRVDHLRAQLRVVSTELGWPFGKKYQNRVHGACDNTHLYGVQDQKGRRNQTYFISSFSNQKFVNQKSCGESQLTKMVAITMPMRKPIVKAHLYASLSKTESQAGYTSLMAIPRHPLKTPMTRLIRL